MDQSASANALRRKTSAGQHAREVQGLTPTRAIRISLARAAGDLWELPLSVSAIRHSQMDAEDLRENFDDDTLLLLLDGPDGVRGGMAIDRALLTSVTEVQTIGAVTERPPGTRTLTPTDAALVAPLVDAMLERVDVSLNGAEHEVPACDRSEAAWVLGYRFGAMVDRKRTLLLALEGDNFHLLRMEVDIAAGMRKGCIVLCLPERLVPQAAPEPDTKTEPGEHADALASLPARLTATLPRFELPLSKATGLKVGDVIPMAPEVLSDIALRGSDGRSLARATLGKIGDMRALRLNGPRGDANRTPPPKDDGFTAGVASKPKSGKSRGKVEATPPARTPQKRDAYQEAALPDLPPLDFDAAYDDVSASGNLDVGNVNFE